MHTTRLVLEQFPNSHSKRHLPDPRILHPTADAEHLGAGVGTLAQSLIPVDTVCDDAGQVTQRFNVIYDGGLTPQTAYLRERRLCARVGPFAFQSIQQSGFFPANIATRTGVQDDIQVVSCAEDIAPEITFLVRLSDRLFECFYRTVILTAQKYVSFAGANCVSADYHPFKEKVGVALHQETVLEGSWFHLICIHHEVLLLW